MYFEVGKLYEIQITMDLYDRPYLDEDLHFKTIAQLEYGAVVMMLNKGEFVPCKSAGPDAGFVDVRVLFNDKTGWLSIGKEQFNNVVKL